MKIFFYSPTRNEYQHAPLSTVSDLIADLAHRYIHPSAMVIMLPVVLATTLLITAASAASSQPSAKAYDYVGYTLLTLLKRSI